MIYIPSLLVDNDDYRYFIDLDHFLAYVERTLPSPVPSFYHPCLEEIDTDYDVEEDEDIIFFVTPDYSQQFDIQYPKRILELYLKDFDNA